jgi:nitrous oxidase accessory protein
VASQVRYGLHYMFSDDNVFEDNRFEFAAAGSAIMYSDRIQFRRNQFLHNRGFASVGLLFQDCDDVTAEDNLIADNARGIFLEGSRRDSFRGNLIAESDMDIVLYDSCANIRFEGLLCWQPPLMLVGRRTDTVVRELLAGQPRTRPGRRRPHGPPVSPSGVRSHTAT